MSDGRETTFAAKLAFVILAVVLAGGVILSAGITLTVETASLFVLGIVVLHGLSYSMAFVARKGWSKGGVL